MQQLLILRFVLRHSNLAEVYSRRCARIVCQTRKLWRSPYTSTTGMPYLVEAINLRVSLCHTHKLVHSV